MDKTTRRGLFNLSTAPVIFAVSIFSAVLLLASCGLNGNDDDDDVSNTANANVSSTPSLQHDGVYIVTFVSENRIAAQAKFGVELGLFSGKLINTLLQEFLVSGLILTDGTLSFDEISLSKDSAVEITAEGKIDEERILTGTYALADREGSYNGFAISVSETVDKFDGFYRITFIRDGLQSASTCFEIINGTFSGPAWNIAGDEFSLVGRVLESGKLLIEALIDGDDSSVISHGMIDGDTISGEYTELAGPGIYTGLKAESCARATR